MSPKSEAVSTSIAQISFLEVCKNIWFSAVWTVVAMCLMCPLLRAKDGESTGTDVKKVFYSAKDRQQAMHAAMLLQPKDVSSAKIMEGPPQEKKQFQLHYNDKVICDFATSG